MITLDQAQSRLNKIKYKPAAEQVSLDRSLDRILARDVVSQIDMPPFDKSAMDGYAVSAADGSLRFRIVETVSAGTIPGRRLQKGECARIMTGAEVPPGADKVVIKEHTEEEGDDMILLQESAAVNICYRGEDVKVGDVVLHQGTRIGPAEAGVIASMGLPAIDVFRKPRVGIITTGSEIREPGEGLEPGHIYNSNAYSLSAQVERAGAVALYRGIVRDDPGEIKQAVSSMLVSCDLLLISGGVSMGDYDFVPGILANLGAVIHFDKVAVKPGKPTVFATHEEKVIFGLPGNPVSTFVIFEIFVKPLLFRMMGHHFLPLSLRGKMAVDYKRKRTGRTAFIPVMYRQGEVEPVTYHGSAHILALTRANGLLEIPAGQSEIIKGSTVHVRPI